MHPMYNRSNNEGIGETPSGNQRVQVPWLRSCERTLYYNSEGLGLHGWLYFQAYNGFVWWLENEVCPSCSVDVIRVALAAALFSHPDLLLLDEPTNHLDLPTVTWLQDFLVEYEGTCIFVSHDRYFLNYIVTDIILLRNKVCDCSSQAHAIEIVVL